MRTQIDANWWTAHSLAALMRDNGIYLDDSFQSYHRWVTENNQHYMRSLLNGKAPTSIYLADIAKCQASVEKKYGRKHEDYIFYQELLDKGYKYITIDGNNRTRCVTDFFFGIFQGLFPLFVGEYEIGGTINMPILLEVTNDSKYFEDLDPRFRNLIENIDITVKIVESGTREDLADLFESINKGMTLNAQEKRNCKMYLFSRLVRECVAKYRDKLEKIYSERGFNRRVVDEFVVDIAVLCARGIIGFGPSKRDEAYGDNTVEVKSFSKADKIVGQIADLVVFRTDGDKVVDCGKKTATNVFDLGVLLNYMNNNDIVYTDKKKFFEEYCDAQIARIADPTILWSKKDGTDDRGYAGIQRSNQRNFVTIRENELIASLSDFSDGLIISRDSTRDFKRDVAFLFDLWRKQKGICPETGKEINCRDILNGDIIHVDHQYPWSKGGSTTKSNAALVYASANRKKGATVPVKIKRVDPLDN